MKLKHIFNNELTKGSDKWEPYFDVYERYLSKFIDKSPTIIEVGVQSGGSLEMWRNYFGEGATIVGIDIDPRVLQNKVDGVDIIIGDQSDPSLWDSIFEKYPNVDIFIDDGGHYMNQQISTFNRVFPRVNIGGVYICEDTHTSYMSGNGGGFMKPSTFIEYSKRLVDVLHKKHIEGIDSLIDKEYLKLVDGLSSVNFYDSQVVFLKDDISFNRIFANKEKIEEFLNIKL